MRNSRTYLRWTQPHGGLVVRKTVVGGSRRGARVGRSARRRALELLRRDLVRSERRVGPRPAADAVLFEPRRELLVDGDDEHVGDLGATIRLDPLLELAFHPRVGHRHQKLAVHGPLAHDRAQLASRRAVDRPRGVARVGDQVELARAARPERGPAVVLAPARVRLEASRARRCRARRRCEGARCMLGVLGGCGRDGCELGRLVARGRLFAEIRGGEIIRTSFRMRGHVRAVFVAVALRPRHADDAGGTVAERREEHVVRRRENQRADGHQQAPVAPAPPVRRAAAPGRHADDLWHRRCRARRAEATRGTSAPARCGRR